MFKLILLAGAGSFLGGAIRFAIGIPFQNRSLFYFPHGTLIVNLLGCFLIGVLYTVAEKGSINTEWRTFFIAGVLGGFTTFSAFSAETIELFRNGLALRSLLYAGISVFGGLAATALGIYLFGR
ncbi:MAG: fluoride efflux transporter CrcB [Chitinophagaceae bacterium]|nr:fluoride efflux transporter CrcB [Chitinophagaceae bacterium]MCZ2395157.1 fluoride efflux transporter CrcB [Chitinophagales bacterium]